MIPDAPHRRHKVDSSRALALAAHLRAIDRLVKKPEDGTEIGRELTDVEKQNRIATRFERFTRIAEAAGGNQIVLTVYDALGLLTMDVYDRYIGLLTLVS